MLRGGPGIFAAAPDQPSLSGQRKGRRVADMVRISADMRRAAGGVRGEPVAEEPRFFLSIAIRPVEQGQPVSGIVAMMARGDDGMETQGIGDGGREAVGGGGRQQERKRTRQK